MNLSLLILIPLATAVAVLLTRTRQQVRWVSFIGAAVQIILSLFLFVYYRNEVAAGNTAQMLFQQNYEWFPALHIGFHLGVDGISVALIMLTAFVVIAGILVSWNIEKMTKEFYFLLLLIERWRLWLFYVPRSFHAVLLFGNCGYSKIFIDRYLGKR